MGGRTSRPGVSGLSYVALLVLVVAGWGALWVGANVAAPRVVDRVVPRLLAQAGRLGVEVTDLSPGVVCVGPTLTAVNVDRLSARFDLNPTDDRRLRSELSVRMAQVRLRRPLALRGSIRATGLDVTFDPADLPDSLPFDRFTNGTIEIGDLPLTRPSLAVQEVLEGLEELFIENEVVGVAFFEGDVKIAFDDGPMAAHLYTERDGDRFRLRFRASDIEALAERKQLDLAPEQIEIVSRYPLRMPELVVLTERARSSSWRHEPDDFWLRDAHRHVIWSFSLTQRFGPDFAQLVTDAQEKRDGNTPDERAMDFHNNAIGRRFAAQNVAPKNLPQLVRDDPDVIRHPDEVAVKGEARLLR